MQVRKNILMLILSASITLFVNNVFAAQTSFVKPENAGAKSRLIASFYEDKGQKKLIAGFEIELGSGWKIYAPDDSGFGIPPAFDFEGSTNIKISQSVVNFPKSYTQREEIGDDFIEYQVYKEKIIIPLELEIVDADQKTNLQIKVDYALCKELCVPVTQSFSLEIPASQIDEKSLQKIQQYLSGKTIFSSDKIAQDTVKKSHKISLFQALITAFIGGVILNIMPCVLPVLSIKLLSVINHNQSKLSKIRFAFFSTTLGIIFSFAIFATVAVILKSFGSAIGWGFQFQNPYFLIFLITILVIFVANLLDLFEFNFGSSLGSVLNNEISKKEKNRNVFLPNFFSGILAVLLATPCSAPFVGVAISFALSSDVKEIFLIFGSMSIGLSLPYLFLIAFPKSVRLMPKPGAWMLKTKQLMAGFLIATVAWLIYVLVDNIGFIAATSAAILAIFILLFFKIVHKSHLKNQEKPFSKKKITIITIIFVFLISSIFIIPNRLAYLDDMMEKSQSQYWIKFEESKIQDLVKEGKVVVIDITADWCITCKANKILVLNSDVIKEQLKKPDVIAMRGDLTKPDSDIFNFMQKYDRYGIPFNMVFGPNAPKGILVSELTSKDELLSAIKKASQQ
jgi:suppressor for copper-sensitivity B